MINDGFLSVLNYIHEQHVIELTHPSIDNIIYKSKLDKKDVFEFKKQIREYITKNNDNVFNSKIKEEIKIVELLNDDQDKYMYYYDHICSQKKLKYYELLTEKENFKTIHSKSEDHIRGYIFSEIESSLIIEDIPTTKKKIEEISLKQKNELQDVNEIIIANMIDGYNFMFENEITYDNLFNLYNILSNNCLPDNLKLKDGMHFRSEDDVYIDIYKGASVKNIECMLKELIEYINSNLNEGLTAHIAHFYLLYIHPYNDFNGRTARALSFWVNLKSKSYENLFFISESIKHNKSVYYKALQDTRNNDLDLTYFITSIYDLAVKHIMILLNLEKIENTIIGNGFDFKTAYKDFLYKAMTLKEYGEGYFNWKRLNEIFENKKQKSYVLRILNELVDLNVLTAKENKTKLFKINYNENVLYNINKL